MNKPTNSKEKNNIVPLREKSKPQSKLQNSSRNAKVSKTAFRPRQVAQPSSQPEALVLVQIMEWSFLEEAFGQSLSSELAGLVMHRLQNCLRPSDLVKKMGLHEYVIQLVSIESIRCIEKLMTRIEQHCSGEYVCSDFSVHIRLIAGIAMATSNAVSHEEQVRNARIALRHAERDSTQIYRFFSPNMLAQIRQQGTIISDMHRALKEQRFILHYQPQYSVDDGREIIAMEALLRMYGQNGRLLYPAQFIDLAEKTGLIIPIGYWVILEACRQYRFWQDMGYAPRYVAVNVSAKQLSDKNLVAVIDEAIEQNGIDYSNLELEITEQNLIEKIHLTKSILTELSAKGVRIALDDFGIGYSSLTYLEHLPLDVIKIDRSFLHQWHLNKKSAGIIKYMINMAKELGLEVVVEGVENLEQKQFVQLAGAHLGQGFGYSEPNNVYETTTLLQRSTGLIRIA